MSSSSHPLKCNEFDVYDHLAYPGLRSEMDQVNHKLNEVRSELEQVKKELNEIKSSMMENIEQAVMVAEAHIELRLEEHMEARIPVIVEKEVTSKVKVEIAIISGFVMVITFAAGVIGRSLGF